MYQDADSQKFDVLDLQDSPENLAEAKTHGFLISGYEFGETYSPPDLSANAKSCAGYICDDQPADFNNQCLVRATANPIHKAEFQATVSGRFVDSRFFNERSMILEILQNAEPRDSKGTWFDLQFFADGKWRSVIDEIDQFSNDQISKMRIVDNGKGYLPTDMVMIGGGKRTDAVSAGQFGTGMKISDRSAVEHGVKIVRYSRNWRAQPELRNTVSSAGPEQIVRYKTEFFEECLPGSVVEYSEITGGMIDILRNIGNYYLPLDRTLPERLLDENEFGLVLSPKDKSPQIMVKGRIYTLDVEPEEKFLFSYDLRDCTIDDQNRHFVSTKRAEQNIRFILENCSSEAVFKALLENLGQDVFELQMPGLHRVPETFKNLLAQYFEIPDFEKSFIDDGKSSENTKILKRRGYKAVNSQKSKFIEETLMNLGTKDASEFIEKISTREYRAVDNPENHVEESVQVGFLTIQALECTKDLARQLRIDPKNVQIVGLVAGVDGQKEVPYSDLIGKKVPELQCLQIRLTNFSYEKSFRYLHSYTIAQILMPLLNALKSTPLDAYVYCGDLEFSPSGLEQRKEIYKRSWPNMQEDRFEVNIVIDRPDLRKQVEELHNYSFDLNPEYKPFEKTPAGDVVSLTDSKIYVSGVLRPEKDRNPGERWILSYNIESKDTAREISRIVSRSERPEVPEAILAMAKKDPQTEYLEYNLDLYGDTTNWVKAFENLFGENAVVNDLKNNPLHDHAQDLAERSNFVMPNLNARLVKLLIECGVKTLSSAVQASKCRKYDPKPLQSGLLEVSKLIDMAVNSCLPADAERIAQNIEVVEADSIYNGYGQKLDTKGKGYMDPLVRDTTVFLADTILTPSNVAELIEFLVSKRIQAYKPSLSDEEFLLFKGKVTMAMSNYITADFLKKFRGFFAKWLSAAGAVKIIEVQMDKVGKELSEKKEEDEREFNLKAIAAKNKAAAEKRERRAKKWAERKAAIGEAIEAIKEKLEFSLPSLGAVGRISAKVALLTVLALGAKGVANTGIAQEIGRSIGSSIRGKLGNLFSSDEGFQRSEIGNNFPVGVEVENTAPGESEPDDNVRHVAANFVSQPTLSWGSFMSEKVLNWFDGKQWTYLDNDDLALPDVNFATVRRIAHYQKILPNPGQLKLRNLAGGKIDPQSIELVDVEGKSYTLERVKVIHQTGEVEITIPSTPEIRAITYQTLSNADWEATADTLTEADLEALPQDSYKMLTFVSGYITEDHQIDYDRLSKVKLNPAISKDFNNLGDFIRHMHRLNPYDRVKNVRSLINNMRYTITTRTQEAFKKFHDDDLPEKDLIEFAFNSAELEKQGDGDCDVQNSLFALLTRLSGVPTKLDFVITKDGVGHAPASIYLPKIGWVLMDTMGKVSLQEQASGQSWVIHNNIRQLGAVEAQEALRRRLKLIQQDKDRNCGVLEED